MRARIHVGIDAERHRCRHAQSSTGDGIQRVEFCGRLALQAENSGAERQLTFRFRSCRPPENTTLAESPPAPITRASSPPETIDSRALARQEVQHREIRVRLHRVADEVVGAGERVVEGAEPAFERGPRIDVTRRAERAAEFGQRDALGVQFAVDAWKGVHGTTFVRRTHGLRGVSGAPETSAGGAPVVAAGVADGSLSGPLTPQPANVAATRIAVASRAPRARRERIGAGGNSRTIGRKC